VGTFTRVLGQWLAARGHEVHVLGEYDDVEIREDYEDAGVRVHRFPRATAALGKRAQLAMTRLRLRGEVKRLCARYAIQLIEGPAHTYGGGLWLVPRVAPLICRIHSSRMLMKAAKHGKASWNDRLVDRGARHAGCFVAVSPWARDQARLHWRPAAGREVLLIPNPITNCFFEADELPAPEEPDTVVFSGSLNEQKGIRELLGAWPQVRESHPALSLHVYGKAGRCSRDVADAVSDSASRVYWHGPVSQHDLAAALRRARLAVFPSHFETFGLAAAEAAAAGAPLVVSDIPPYRSLFGEDGVAAYCRSRDAESLMQALLSALSGTRRARAAVAKARERMHQFRVEQVGPINEALYSKVIGEGTRVRTPSTLSQDCPSRM